MMQNKQKTRYEPQPPEEDRPLAGAEVRSLSMNTDGELRLMRAAEQGSPQGNSCIEVAR